MARGRMINQTIDYDPEFNALSITAQLFYLRSLAFLDRDGLIIGHPRGLLSKVAPLLDFSQDDVLDMIDEWVDQGLVIRYRAKVGDVLFFKGFGKNQSGMHYDRETPSRFDPPPGWTYGPKGLVQIESAPVPTKPADSFPTESEPTPTESLEDVPIESGVTPDEVRQESGDAPDTVGNESAPIEVKDQVKDQIQELQGDEEDTRARDPVADAWQEHYGEPIPGNLSVRIANLTIECGPGAVVYGIKASIEADARNFRYIAQCARNYLPAAPATETNGYQVDLPGVYALQPPAHASPPPKPLPPMAHDDPWAIALAEILPTLSPHAASWLKESRLRESGELAGMPLYRVIAQTEAGNIGWLSQQAEPLIRKTLSSIFRKRLLVEIVAEQEPLTA